jgi:hypothetical protein
MIDLIDVEELFDNYPELFEKFEGIFDVGPGWKSIIEDMCLTLDFYSKEQKNKISILDVRNHFGTLIIDYSGGNELIDKFIKLAERISFFTCEECGKKGNLCSSNGTEFGQFKTLCEKDALRLNYRIYELPKRTKPTKA